MLTAAKTIAEVVQTLEVSEQTIPAGRTSTTGASSPSRNVLRPSPLAAWPNSESASVGHTEPFCPRSSAPKHFGPCQSVLDLRQRSILI